jgi:hypothetical protein
MKRNKTMKKKLFLPSISIAVLLFSSGSVITSNKTAVNYNYITVKDTIINFEKRDTGKMPGGFTQTATK